MSGRDDEQRQLDAEQAADWREFHTPGPNCHWCYHRPAAYLWCPWSTHVCEVCQALILAGREWEVVEGLAAQMTVRDRWMMIDPEHAREHWHDVMNRWIEAKGHAHRIDGEPIHDPRHVETFGDSAG
jgi:hypothetical protein